MPNYNLHKFIKKPALLAYKFCVGIMALVFKKKVDILSETSTTYQLDYILKRNDAVIEHTRKAFGFCPEHNNEINFQTLFIDVLKNYSRFCLKAPASEGYHHAFQYGLVEHSLQVANMSMRQAKSQFLPPLYPMDIERKRKKRYQYAAFLCGLLHDAGKLHTDMDVVDSRPKFNDKTMQIIARYLLDSDLSKNTDSPLDETSNTSSNSSGILKLTCKSCSNIEGLKPRAGRYGYFFKCPECNTNTALKNNCSQCGSANTKVSKRKEVFSLSCIECLHTNKYI